MKPITAVIEYTGDPSLERLRAALNASVNIERVLVVKGEQAGPTDALGPDLFPGPLSARTTLDLIIDRLSTEYLLLLTGSRPLSLHPSALETMVKSAKSTRAGMVYADFHETDGEETVHHPLNDYQRGSVRDTFDFGPIQLFSASAIRRALKAYEVSAPVRFAGLYDLRLRVSIDHPIHHVAEPLYGVSAAKEASKAEAIFAYQDPKNVPVQKEMEAVFTDYLKAIGAYLPSGRLKLCEGPRSFFPVEASVVIPVRNRAGTIEEAIRSALTQETDFSFNVIVVDNHSIDGTAAILSDLVRRHAGLKVLLPLRTDHSIGGCWNEALYSTPCGRYAVQLDSDDLYASTGTLQRMVDTLRRGGFGMVIGAYTIVDETLSPIEPGLIDHREWSDENGHNNALRINGLGAPRAFDTGLMREIGFLDVGYGEDYAAALRICGKYRVGRIYDSLYLCRRWSGNTDAALTLEETNRNDAFKDRIRTEEILVRQEMIRGSREGQP